MNYKKLVNSIKSINQSKIVDGQSIVDKLVPLLELFNNWKGSEEQISELKTILPTAEVQGREISNRDITIKVDEDDALSIVDLIYGRSAKFDFDCVKIEETTNFDPSKQSISRAKEICTAVNNWSQGKGTNSFILPGDWTSTFKNSVKIDKGEYVLFSSDDDKYKPLGVFSEEAVRKLLLSGN